MQVLLEVVEDLGAHAQRVGEARARRPGTTMNSWKSTELSACAPPLSTFIIGTGRIVRRLAAEVAPQRLALLRRRRVRGGERDAEDRVGARGGTCSACRRGRSARGRGRDWSSASRPRDRLRDLAVDVRDGLRDALAELGVAAVAQLGGLELAGRGAGRHGGAAVRAGAQRDSTSTVGLPRESRIWRAWTDSIWLMSVLLGSGLLGEAGLRVVARAGPRDADRSSPRRRAAARASAPSTRPRKRSAAARSASSGSTFSLRATLTAANSTSPTSWKRRLAVARPPRARRARPRTAS